MKHAILGLLLWASPLSAYVIPQPDTRDAAVGPLRALAEHCERWTPEELAKGLDPADPQALLRRLTFRTRVAMTEQMASAQVLSFRQGLPDPLFEAEARQKQVGDLPTLDSSDGPMVANDPWVSDVDLQQLMQLFLEPESLQPRAASKPKEFHADWVLRWHRRHRSLRMAISFGSHELRMYQGEARDPIFQGDLPEATEKRLREILERHRVPPLNLAALGSYERLPGHDGGAAGLLRYADRQIVIISMDVGSGVTSQDLRIYALSWSGFYHPLLTLPLLSPGGYDVEADGDMLRVYQTSAERDRGPLILTTRISLLLASKGPETRR